MRLFKLFLPLVLLVFVLAGCKKDPAPTPSNPVSTNKPAAPFNGAQAELVKKISKRWDVTSEIGKTATNYYGFFEFNEWGTYIVYYTDGSVATGNFTVGSNNVTLNVGSAVFNVTSTTDSTLNFSIILDGDTTFIESFAAQAIANSANTTKLVGTWKINKFVYTSNGYSQTYLNVGKVVFSQWGTYLSNTSNGGATSVSLRPWKWKDAAEVDMCYGLNMYDGVDCSYVTKISTLTATNMVMEQTDVANGVSYRYELSASL